MSRTNIDLDDTALEIVMRRHGLHTKTEAVNHALRSLAGRPMSKEEILSMFGANFIDDVPIDVGP